MSKRSYGNEYFSVYINPKIANQWNPFITVSLASPKHCSLFTKRTQFQAQSPFNIHKRPSNSTNIDIFMGSQHLPDVTSLTANNFPSTYWLFHFSCLLARTSFLFNVLLLLSMGTSLMFPTPYQPCKSHIQPLNSCSYYSDLNPGSAGLVKS